MDKFEREKRKYEKAYKLPGYKMGDARKNHALNVLREYKPGSLLDVGCGRGEMLDAAENMGFDVRGVEIVDDLIDGTRVVRGKSTKIPFPTKSFDYLVCLDVIEHLLPEDTEDTFKEFARVAKKKILVCIANWSDTGHIGEELHINRKPYTEWDDLLKNHYFPNDKVVWLPKKQNISETWEITLW